MHRVIVVLCFALFHAAVMDPAHAQGTIPLGVGAGTYTSAAGARDSVASFDFAHAIAYLDREATGDKREFTVVLLSDVRIDEARARDEGYLAEEAKAGRLQLLQVRIADADGRVTAHAAFDRRGRTTLESPDKARFVRTTFNPTRIEGGLLFYPSPDPSAEMQRGYTASFNARIRQGPWRNLGEAAGTIRIGTRTFNATHAVMIEESDQTTAVIGSGPLGESVDPADRGEFAARVAAGGMAVLWVTVANDGKVQLARCLGPGLPEGDAEAPTVSWHREDWTSKVMRGRLVTRTAPPNSPCSADVYFAAGPW